jgi:predicted NBD/HSP70 family sugar kinase
MGRRAVKGVTRGDDVQVRRTVRDLRRHNRSVLLSSLYLGEPQSRQDLGRSSGLSQGTVSNVVGELIEEGLVVEAGLVDSDGGRPRTLLRVNPDHAYVVGVDVGETGTRVEVFDLAMGPLATVEHPLPSPRPDPAAVVAQVHEGLEEVLGAAGVTEPSVLGLGVGVFGTVEQGAEATVHTQTLGWEAVPLERMLRAGTSLPIYLENGAKTLGQAELWFGAARGAQHAVITLVGSGVGAAVISNGTISRGATSSAGEWGHTCLVYDGRPCRCGSRGCLEAYVGAEAVLDRWKAARGGRALPGTDEQSSLDALLADGGKVAERVLAETAGYLGAGLANLVNLFNPERIVLAGWAGHALGGRLLPQITAAAAERALRHPFGQTSIQLGQLGLDAVALGAATLPVADLLARGAAPDRPAASSLRPA